MRAAVAVLLWLLQPLVAAQQQQEGKCEVQSYTLRSDVHLRYATSMLRVQLANPERTWRTLDCHLHVVIPETAFLSGVLAEVGDKVIETKVIERKEEEPDDDDASFEPFEVPRDSKHVRIGVTLRAQETAVLFVSYEQLVTRRLGIYELVLNVHPGQVVPELRLDALVHESRPLAVLRVLGIRSGHEIDPLETHSEFPLAKVVRASESEAHVIFSPSRKQQAQMANSRPWSAAGDSRGLAGQLVLQYELTRPKDGEVTVKDGFFVHHYAPTALSVLPKHVVFVLDLSSSMAGRRIAQLKLAMDAILDELRPDDFFSIVQFNSFKSVWSPFGKEKRNRGSSGRVVAASARNVAKAKRYIKQLKAMGGTNIQKALVKAVDVAHSSETPLALVVLLTDGETTVGESTPGVILKAARDANRRPRPCPQPQEQQATDAPCAERHVPVYSLAFGEEANIAFLRRLSAENFGAARRIYDADDAAIQLHEVYAELAAPVQSDCTFKYPDEAVEAGWLTQHRFAAAFLGSELLVAGKLATPPSESAEVEFWGEVSGAQAGGQVATVHLPDAQLEFYPATKFNPNLSRLWAYLTVFQLLLGSAARDSREEATHIALEYSFVTATTTLQPHFEGDHDDVATSILRVWLPAAQEVGYTEASGGGGGGDVCAEGGEGEYWFPLQQAFIPCGERKVTLHVPGSQQQLSTERFGRNQLHESDNRVDHDDDSHAHPRQRAPFDAEPKHSLVELEALAWLREVRYGPRYLVLPKGRGGENQLFSLGLNESNEVHAACLSPLQEQSHCRHLHFCALDHFKDDFYQFLRFFCSINHFAGVCCPDSVFEEEEEEDDSAGV